MTLFNRLGLRRVVVQPPFSLKNLDLEWGVHILILKELLLVFVRLVVLLPDCICLDVSGSLCLLLYIYLLRQLSGLLLFKHCLIFPCLLHFLR